MEEVKASVLDIVNSSTLVAGAGKAKSSIRFGVKVNKLRQALQPYWDAFEKQKTEILQRHGLVEPLPKDPKTGEIDPGQLQRRQEAALVANGELAKVLEEVVSVELPLRLSHSELEKYEVEITADILQASEFFLSAE